MFFSEYRNCTLKDYLNFFCSACNKNLCKEHYHNELSCPLNSDKKINLTVIPLIIKSSHTNENKKQPLDCAFKLCEKQIFNSIGYDCKLCNLTFCMTHRLECDHDCKNKKVSFKNKYLDNKDKFKDKLNQLKNKN